MASSEEVRIPQKPPMVMVDRVMLSEGGTTVTQFLVREDNVFVSAGKFTEPGLIENMAQTAAAGTGAQEQDGEPRTGFIGAVSKLHITRLPAAGSVLTTTVTVPHAVMNATVIHAAVEEDGEEIASCEMKIFLMS